MSHTVRPDDAWIRCFQSPPKIHSRLFCFPHAGGSASYFHPLSRALSGTAAQIAAVQYPGRQERRREPCIDNIPEAADLLCTALADWADLPMALFGHSMGALLAYEVGRRLEDRGITVLSVFVSGRRAPSVIRHEDVHRRDDAGLVEEIKSLSGTDPAVFDDPEIIESSLPAIRNDYKAAETYVHVADGMLNCPLTALVGDSDPRVSQDEVRAWSEHTRGDFLVRVFPGGHFYLDHHLPEIAATISDDLRLRLAHG
ncbi:thioesterase II family protein [Streptomyces tsukubensis]|uniref:Thioesterase n=1 Tax=Streptomyces tsukubensis TaxID=83656 RepID=A0A1V3ZZS7_9ACTN|nr:alpha/beta fold hydrolase [Streptomyces tsukubensis]OON71709.1 thioesterase [Streptomyces tsukubensis]QFR96070.1 alpha/beta fold hydrolase [Streptomyces tsukubensis]